ncbi:MAG: biotin transporter BioY [Deltaproteobacteria bacterium]|nr:biotin transporter BioY [Deltaproteobacteria bacterium]
MTADISPSEMRRLVRLAVWASLMALGAWVVIPVGAVPVTLQTFFIFLAAFVEGPRASLAATLYLLAGLVGLPVFAGGQAGPSLLFGPSAGYALSFPLVAALAGLGRGEGSSGGTARLAGAALASLALLYFCGSVGLAANHGLNFKAALAVNLTFAPFDLMKILCAGLVASRIAKRRSKSQGLRKPRKTS